MVCCQVSFKCPWSRGEAPSFPPVPQGRPTDGMEGARSPSVSEALVRALRRFLSDVPCGTFDSIEGTLDAVRTFDTEHGTFLSVEGSASDFSGGVSARPC